MLTVVLAEKPTMTVKELIAKLVNLPSDHRVILAHKNQTGTSFKGAKNLSTGCWDRVGDDMVVTSKEEWYDGWDEDHDDFYPGDQCTVLWAG